jgi:hypothetical protein
MQGKTAEIWRELCSQAAQEQDPNRLLELTLKINTLLEEKEQRLKRRSNTLMRGNEGFHDGSGPIGAEPENKGDTGHSAGIHIIARTNREPHGCP